jgi:hypothetical protein
MPLTVADRFEIHELAARYAHAIDFGDAEGWADCFTADGAFESTLQGRVEGRDALMAFCRSTPTGMKPRHWTNHWIMDGAANVATATCYGLLLDGAANGRPILTFRYRDRLRKVNGRWKFVERFADIDPMQPPIA